MHFAPRPARFIDPPLPGAGGNTTIAAILIFAKERPMRLRFSPSGLFILCLAMMISTSAAAAEPIHDIRPLSGPIETLSVHGEFDVLLVQDGTMQVDINAAPALAKLVRVAVDNGVLGIDTEPMTRIELPFTHGSHPMITVHVPALGRIEITGTGNLTSNAWSSPSELRLDLNSSGDLKIHHLSAKKVTTTIKGSADVELAGTAAEEEVRILGSGDYRAGDLKAASATVAILGSGDASVWAQDALAVSIKGSGDVEYFGQPSLAQSVNGSGNVTGRGPR
jgi:hypothetical protein